MKRRERKEKKKTFQSERDDLVSLLILCLFCLATPWGLWDLISWFRDWTQVSTVKALCPNHRTAREFLDDSNLQKLSWGSQSRAWPESRMGLPLAGLAKYLSLIFSSLKYGWLYLLHPSQRSIGSNKKMLPSCLVDWLRLDCVVLSCRADSGSPSLLDRGFIQDCLGLEKKSQLEEEDIILCSCYSLFHTPENQLFHLKVFSSPGSTHKIVAKTQVLFQIRGYFWSNSYLPIPLTCLWQKPHLPSTSWQNVKISPFSVPDYLEISGFHQEEMYLFMPGPELSPLKP